ncbi:hypothetical protein M5689_005010 [Euphorbia peplus]|nr:hypothetical protein M5689_005010 [Euphorbia peplus]
MLLLLVSFCLMLLLPMMETSVFRNELSNETEIGSLPQAPESEVRSLPPTPGSLFGSEFSSIFGTEVGNVSELMSPPSASPSLPAPLQLKSIIMIIFLVVSLLSVLFFVFCGRGLLDGRNIEINLIRI